MRRTRARSPAPPALSLREGVASLLSPHRASGTPPRGPGGAPAAALPGSGSASSVSSDGGGGSGSSSPGSPVPPPALPEPARRWRDWWLRWATALGLIFGVLGWVWFARQLGVVVFVFTLQTLIYVELVRLAQRASVEAQMPTFRAFYVYWFAVFSFFMYASVLKAPVLAALASSSSSGDPLTVAGIASTASSVSRLLLPVLRLAAWLLRNAVPVSFALYMGGVVAFVLSLHRRRNFRYQFQQFGFCHLALIVVMGQSSYLVASAFQGLFWFLLPITLVATNDCMAYVCGVMFGRTPLIRLSPKKTVEGFVGGAAFTVVGALLMTTAVTQWLGAHDVKYVLLCPASAADLGLSVARCDTDVVAGGIFRLAPLREWWFKAWVPAALLGVRVCEMHLHSLALAAFASCVAPFGGFFASGFKRAFHVKDFGSALPGHGGFTDRMDCQIVMGAISALYMSYVLQIGVGFRGGLADVGRLFARVVDRYSADDVRLLQQLLVCYAARMPPAAAGARARIAEAARECLDAVPRLFSGSVGG